MKKWKVRLLNVGVLGVMAVLAAGTGSDHPPTTAAPPAARRQNGPTAQAPAGARAAPAPSARGPETGFWAQPMQDWKVNPCPEGVWALFREVTPGENEFERRANDARRAELSAAARGRTYVVHVDAQIGEYDFRRHRFPVVYDDAPSCGSALDRTFAVGLGARPTARQSSTVFGVGNRSWYTQPIPAFVDMAEDQAAALRRQGDRVQLDVAFRLSARTRWDAGRPAQNVVGAWGLVEGQVVAVRVRAGGRVLSDTAPAVGPADAGAH